MVHGLYGLFLGLILLVQSSCFSPYYVTACQKWIDASYLASAHVSTPDPRQAHPPLGQMLIINWRLTAEQVKKNPEIVLDVIFWDYTTKQVKIPIEHAMDYATYRLIDEEYTKTGGILTYKVAAVTPEDEVLYEWKHQLYVDLITVTD